MGDFSPLVGKRQYLIIYTQANIEKFPTTVSLGEVTDEEFNAESSKIKVDYWKVCKEPHENGSFHYHCSVKLTGAKKWINVKNQNSYSKYGIQVHFSNRHDYYLSRYQYVNKTDNELA